MSSVIFSIVMYYVNVIIIIPQHNILKDNTLIYIVNCCLPNAVSVATPPLLIFSPHLLLFFSSLYISFFSHISYIYLSSPVSTSVFCTLLFEYQPPAPWSAKIPSSKPAPMSRYYSTPTTTYIQHTSNIHLLYIE